jgi:hypothetical protein
MEKDSLKQEKSETILFIFKFGMNTNFMFKIGTIRIKKYTYFHDGVLYTKCKSINKK